MGASSGLLGQNLHRLAEDELAVDALRGDEPGLVRGGVELGELLEGATLAVGHPVVAEVAEDDGLLAGGDGGHEGRGVDRAAEDGGINQKKIRL